MDGEDQAQQLGCLGLQPAFFRLPKEVRDMIFEHCVHPGGLEHNRSDFRSFLLVNWQMHDDTYNFLINRFIFVLFRARAQSGMIRPLQDLFSDEDVAVGPEQERLAAFPGYAFHVTLSDTALNTKQGSECSMMLIDELQGDMLKIAFTTI